MPIYPGIPWEALEYDITIKKSNPVFTVENLEVGTYYPRIDVKNPQRNWRIQTTPDDRLLIYDLTSEKIRLELLHSLVSSDPQFRIRNSDGAEKFTIDYDGNIITDISLKKNYPILTVEETAPSTYYPRLHLKNPQKNWMLQNDPSGNLKIIDVDAAAARLTITPDGIISGNLDNLTIRGTTVIDSSRRLVGLGTITQDLLQQKNYPALTLEETASATSYPRLYLKNPQRNWLLYNLSSGFLRLHDATAAATRHEVRYNTAADQIQFIWYNSVGTEIMRIDTEGDLTIAGKINEPAVPVLTDAKYPNALLRDGSRTLAGNLLPDAHNTRELGSATVKLANIHSVSTDFGDLGFSEVACPECGEPFKKGDILALKVVEANQGGIRTTPIHLKCAKSLENCRETGNA